jgi:protein-disulfide isomerase
MHPHAPAAAEAAEAAADAGKFWEMYDQLYAHQQALTDSDLRTYAEAIGIDARHVRAAIEKQTYAERIERDVTSGERSAIEGTPALFINGFAYDDEVTVEALGATIDRVLKA